MPEHEFEQLTVEAFLAKAFDPATVFEGHEWADSYTEAKRRSAEKASGKAKPGDRARPGLKYDPPLARFVCEGCDSQWDAWVDDNGWLEEKRDCYCNCGDSQVRLWWDEA